MKGVIGKRVKYYLIGLGMGLVLTFFIFGNRGCSWLPENRVKSQIEESAIIRTDSMKCVLECNDISDDFIYELIEKGEVLFSESSTDTDPKVYILEHKSVKIHFAILEDSVSSIIDINRDKSCDCIGDHVRPIKMTDKMIKTYLNNRDFEIDSKTNCIRDCMGMKKKDLFTFLERSIASESAIKRDNKNPTFDFTSGDTVITIEHGARKNRFIEMSFPGIEKCDCKD
jgi:hypothetical protein